MLPNNAKQRLLLRVDAFQNLRDAQVIKILRAGEVIRFVQENIDIDVRTGVVEVDQADKMSVVLQLIGVIQIALIDTAG